MTEEINYQSEVELAPAPVVDMTLLTKLASDQLALEGRIAKGEDVLKSLKKEHLEIATRRLPEAMQAVGQTAFETDNFRVALESDLKMSLAGVAKMRAITWLREIGEGGSVKTQVILDLGKEPERVKALIAEIRSWSEDHKVPMEIVDDVATATVKSLTRKRLAAGKPVPELATIGGFQWKQSFITIKE